MQRIEFAKALFPRGVAALATGGLPSAFARIALSGLAAVGLLGGVAVFAGAVVNHAAFAGETRCAKAEAAAGAEKSLQGLGEKVFAGEPIRIVAIGSSSTEGTPDIPREAIYAAVLGRELAREIMTPVEIVNKGKGGETIAKMADRLERDVISLHPDLVVWQLGVNDVLQMDGVGGPLERMKSALDMLRARNLPVVLVDLQASPLVDRDRDTPVMQAAIAEAGQRLGVMHFHRQAVMRRLVETEAATGAELVQADGLHMSELAHFCTGQLLARQIARASLIRQTALAPLGLADR